MNKCWNKTMQEKDLWKHIARHMPGGTAEQVKNWFLRTEPNPTPDYLALENIQDHGVDSRNSATFSIDPVYIFGLTVIPKINCLDMEITAKLQHEVMFLVMGTSKEIFLLPCRHTAIRCTHPGMENNIFTFDTSRPPQQFITYIKLTFANGMKKAGMMNNKDNLHFSDIVYRGEGIAQLMDRAESQR